MFLKGQSAIVTGTASAKGMGRAIALLLAEDGAEIALVDIKGSEDTAAAIMAAGGKARAFTLDVTDAAAVETFFGRIHTEMPPLGVLVNNAGVHVGGNDDWTEYPDYEFDRTMNVNLRGAWLMSKQAVPLMRGHHQGGALIHISSMAVRVGGLSVNPAYTISKAALLGLSRAIAVREAKHKIRSNAVCPAVVKTDMLAQFDGGAIERMTAAMPLGKLLDPEDVAEVVRFLATSRSKMMTGETLDVNGGLYFPG